MRILLTLALGFFLLGCDRTRVSAKGCRKDADCGSPASAYRCETQTGECYCRTDEACPPGEYCNPQGFCQNRAGCEKNSDCTGKGTYCDTTTQTCISEGRCTFDLQCPLGQVCDRSKSSCVEGCRSNGDCPGSTCRCGEVPCTCTGTTPEELMKCTIGVCDPFFCGDNTFCRYGELCGPRPDAGTTRNQCYSDFHADRRPYCSTCTSGGGLSTCGDGANYCLIDTAHPGNYFCGADCSNGESCPRGFECSDVVVVYTRWSCSKASTACEPNPSLPCTKDEECKRGGACVIPPGLSVGTCSGRCSLNEGEAQGFCTCLVDSDCAPDNCNMASGRCNISKKRCLNDDECKARCVDFDGVGGCLIGQNCAPAEGLSCIEVGR